MVKTMIEAPMLQIDARNTFLRSLLHSVPWYLIFTVNVLVSHFAEFS